MPTTSCTALYARLFGSRSHRTVSGADNIWLRICRIQQRHCNMTHVVSIRATHRIATPSIVRRVSAPEAIDRDDDAAREALHLLEQGVVVCRLSWT